jgi:hypothetical protein
MIVKGAARSGPYQLAIYLMRVERYDTGEEVELIEFRSPWAASSPGKTRQEVAALIVEAFRDWQDLGEATKNGRDGLYRSEISPAPKYAAGMTREQVIRAADILEEELGFQGQDRVIVRHAGTDGRTHFHAVWPRVNLDTMMMIPDSFNYVAHERASKRMELEFGHEFVAGKHAKRDRERQPEFPRQDHDYAEAQMAQRSNMTPEERKELMTAMRVAAANGQELKKALEDAGYVLAKGDRGYLVVDGAGVHSVLSRNIGLKKDETAAFMTDVPLEALPTIEQAKSMQEAKVQSAQPPAPPVPPPPFAEMTEAERKAQISALRQQSDSAPAFKNALEEAGYLLAHGPRNGFYVLDRQGEVFNLSRLSGISGKEYKEFMAGIDPASVPDVESGKAIQQARAAEAVKPGPEESKFLPAAEAPPPSKFLPEKRGYNFDTYSPVGPTEQEAARLKELKASKFLSPPAKAPEPPAQEAVPVPPPQQVQRTNPSQAAKPIDLSYYSPADTSEREPQKNTVQEVSKFINPPLAKAPEPPPPVPEHKPAQKAHPSQHPGTLKPIDLSYYSPSGVPEHEARKSEPKRSVEKLPLPIEPQPKPKLGDDAQTRPWRKIDPDRKTHITSIKAMADGAQDFERALEEAGYTLASGKGGYTLVDKEGNVFNLFAHIPENKIRLEAFMSPIPLSSLPSVEDVWKSRKEKGIWVPPPPIANTPAGWAPEDQKLYDLERSLLRRAEDEISSLKELHSRQIRTTEIELDREIVQKMGEYKTIQDQQANAFLAARKERRTGLQGILDGIQSRLNPTLAAEAAKARQKEFIDFHRRLSKERAHYENLLQQTKQERMELLHERQAYELSLRQGKLEEERERYIGEYKEAERLRAEYEDQSIKDELEKNDSLGDGPPPPKMGK